MIKLKNFTKNSFLKSWDIPKKVSPSFTIPKVRETGKRKFSTGQIRKQASKQGINLSLNLRKKLSKQKLSSSQLYQRIAYEKRKQKEQQFKRIIQAQGVRYSEFVKRYIGLTEKAWKLNPTKENLKRFQEASELSKKSRLYDERFRPFYSQFRKEIKETHIKMKKSRGIGNVSKPSVSRAGTNIDDYILNYHYDKVQDAMEQYDMNESEAIYEVFNNLIADGTLEVLQQYYDTGRLYGYWDEATQEVISPL